jgi:hypothetical protein
VPRLIHQSNKVPFDKLPERMKNAMLQWKQMNPLWEHKYYSDSDLEQMVAESGNEALQMAFGKLKDHLPLVGAARADLMRYYIVYQQGGVWADSDTTPQDSLDKHVNIAEDDYVSGLGQRNDPHQWLIIAARGHPVLKRALDKTIENIRTWNPPNKISAEGLSGPPVLHRAMLEVLGVSALTAGVHFCLGIPPENPGMPKRSRSSRARPFNVRLLPGDYLDGSVTFKYKGYLRDLAKMNVSYWQDAYNKHSLLEEIPEAERPRLAFGASPALWPTADDEKKLQMKVREWRKELNFMHYPGVLCFGPSCCGLGHRTRRTTSNALQAWAHGQRLKISWMKCKASDKSLWDILVNSSYLYEHYGEWLSDPQDEKEVCERKASNEPAYSKDFQPIGLGRYELKRFGGGLYEESDRVRDPVWQWFFALQQIGLRHTQHGLEVQKFLSSKFWKPGLPVVGVHVRMGNGEVAIAEAGRDIKLNLGTLFRYISQTAERAVREISGKEGQDFRIFVATDTRSLAEAYQKIDPRVFFYEAGAAVPDGQADVMRVGARRKSGGKTVEAGIETTNCASLEQTTLIEATLMGYADILLTPQWSELSGISKVIALARGAAWCENRMWRGKVGFIPDPQGHLPDGSPAASIEVWKEGNVLTELQSEDSETIESVAQEWKSIMNSEAGYTCHQGTDKKYVRVVRPPPVAPPLPE